MKERLRIIKKYASVKHKTKEMLAARKKTDHMLNNCWNEMMTQAEENGRWPVMVLKAATGTSAAESTSEKMGEEIKGTRKYLVID